MIDAQGSKKFKRQPIRIDGLELRRRSARTPAIAVDANHKRSLEASIQLEVQKLHGVTTAWSELVFGYKYDATVRLVPIFLFQKAIVNLHPDNDATFSRSKNDDLMTTAEIRMLGVE